MGILDRAKNFLDQNPAKLNFGMNEIREVNYGATRVVFKITSGPMAGNMIKFPREGDFSKMNEAEVKTWKMAQQKGKTEYFCPIVDYDKKSYSWLIMETADMNVSYSEEREFREEVRQEFSGQQIDLAGCNIGRHNGEVKLIDYTWY